MADYGQVADQQKTLEDTLADPHAQHAKVKVKGEEILEGEIDAPMASEVDVHCLVLDSKGSNHSFKHAFAAIWKRADGEYPNHWHRKLPKLFILSEDPNYLLFENKHH